MLGNFLSTLGNDILKIIGLLTIAVVMSCNGKEKTSETNSLPRNVTPLINSLSSLTKYFEADELKIDTVGRTISMLISNAELLKAKKRRMGERLVSYEPWISIVATQQSKSMSPEVDSLVYNVIVEGNKYRYVYAVKQLKNASQYLSICEQFAGYLNTDNFIKIEEILSKEIINRYDNDQIKGFLKVTFGDKIIYRIELIGTKIVGSKYSLYVNFSFFDDQIQTYAFSFIEGDSKIAGIEIPK